MRHTNKYAGDSIPTLAIHFAGTGSSLWEYYVLSSPSKLEVYRGLGSSFFHTISYSHSVYDRFGQTLCTDVGVRWGEASVWRGKEKQTLIHVLEDTHIDFEAALKD